MIRRLGGRLTCTECGATYHEEFAPPAQDLQCDDCGAELVRREDDQPEAIRERLAAYRESTAPLVDYYDERDVLIDIDGRGTPDEVTELIVEAISP